MEGAAGSPSGPKRPRLGEDAPCGLQSRDRALEGEHASSEPPRRGPQGALPWCAPLLGDPPMGKSLVPRDPVGVAGGAQGAPKRRRAPSGAPGDGEGPSPKAPRRGPPQSPGGGADPGPLPPPSPGDPKGPGMGQLFEGPQLGTRAAGRGHACREPIREMATGPAASLRNDRPASLLPPGPPGPGEPGARPVSPPGGSAQLEEELILQEENEVPWTRRSGWAFPLITAAGKQDDAPLLLIGVSVSLGRDAGNPWSGRRKGLELLPKDEKVVQRPMENADSDSYFLNGILVSTQQKEFPKGNYEMNCFLPLKSTFLESDNLFTVFEMNHSTGLSFELLQYLNEIPKWNFRKLKNDNSLYLKEENGTKSVVPKKRSRNIVQGNNLLLTVFKTSNFAFNLSIKYGHNKVKECVNHKEGNYVSKVPGLCHFITTENIHRDFKNYHNNSFHGIPKGTLFFLFDTYEKVPLLAIFGDTGSISFSKRDYNNNKSSKKAISLEALDALNTRQIPQFIQDSQINTTAHLHKTNTNSQETVIEKKQMFSISSFNFKGKFNCCLDIEQQVKLVNYDPIYIGPNTMTKTQEEFVGNFLSKGKEKMQDLIWNERKHPTAGLTGIHSHQISNGSKTEREEICSITTTNTTVCILKSNLLMKKKPNTEDARERDRTHGNQNNTANRNEHQTILQDSALAHSELFYPNNESTESVKHKLQTDLATRNNEYSPDLPAECLSTETKTVSDFEMKSKFDIVLKELRMFHEIDKEEETSCIGEIRNNEEKNDSDQDNSKEEIYQETKDLTVGSLEKTCAPSLPCDTITGVNRPKKAQSSFKWKQVHMDREKEVPHEYCSSSASDDKSLYSPSGGDFEKALSQNPALFSDAFMEGRIQSLLTGSSSLSHGIVRVYPLKTCRGPIRIGLSRKVKAKQLHPYLK